MTRILARIFSVLFHPILMPLLGLAIIFNTGTYASFLAPEYKLSLYIIVSISTIVLPLCILPFLLYRKIINNIEMDTGRERILPFIITGGFYYLAFYLVSRLSAPSVIEMFLLAGLTALVILMIVNFFWKISIHMAGIGGIIGLIIACSFRFALDLRVLLMLAVAAAGIVGYSRLSLNKHRPMQVYAGFAVGFLTIFLILFYY